MRRLVTLSALLMLLVGLLGGTASAQEDTDDDATLLTLYAEETSAVFITADGTVLDADEAETTPPSAGDRFLSVDTLYTDEERTELAGRNLIECVFVSTTGETEEDFAADLLCNGVVMLDDQGDLAWQTAVTFTADDVDEDAPFATVAITGGTEAFDRAGGEVALFDITAEDDDETLTRYEVRLYDLSPN